MSLRCRLGLHDWSGRRKTDPSLDVIWIIEQTCRRCGQQQRFAFNPMRLRPPPEGLPVVTPSANGTDKPNDFAYSGEDEHLACVRPGTRVHGTLRDGTTVVNSACGHAYRDHMSYRYFGDGKYGWRSTTCHNCACEGFMG